MPDTEWRMTDEQHRAIRHMPMVVDHCIALAEQMLVIVDQLCEQVLTSKRWEKRGKTGHFGIKISNAPGNTRPRIYVHPIDGHGIRIEMTHHVLMKAAAMMGGRALTTPRDEGTSAATVTVAP